MPTLRIKFNYAYYELTKHNIGKQVGVFTKAGDIKMMRWLGFISVAKARALHNEKAAKSVRLNVNQYSNEDTAVRFIDIPTDTFVQGCLTQDGVYCVIEAQVRLASLVASS